MTPPILLYGCRGCGSAAIEALLEIAGARYERREAAPWDGGPAVEALRLINPLVQVPTLVVGDTVVTESAAILMLICDLFPEARLAPPAGLARAGFYRWVTFLAVEVYGAIAIGDRPDHWVGPDARDALEQGALARIKAGWKIMESALTPAPHLLGAELSALDIYAATISRWRPRRAWLAETCPQIAAAIELADRHPVVEAVMARNFDWTDRRGADA